MITRAIDRIGETPLGTPVIEHLRSKGWTFRYGWVPGGWGFAFPWRSIHLKPGLDEDQTLRVLTHEVFHAYLYEGALAASLEQEYNVEANALLLRHELARTPEERARRAAELDAWFRVPMLEKLEEIRQATLWHWARLPQEQPTGLRGIWHALRQAVAIRELKQQAPSKSSVAW